MYCCVIIAVIALISAASAAVGGNVTGMYVIHGGPKK